MHISFVLDQLVPKGFLKVAKRSTQDLSQIFESVTFSTEVDNGLSHKQANGVMHSSQIFQKKHPFSRHHYVVYVISYKLFLRRVQVEGISYRNICVISLYNVANQPYDLWSAAIWEFILHELGHSFGLIPRRRKESFVSALNTVHCRNDCVMNDSLLLRSSWYHQANLRKESRAPFCSRCLEYLLHKKDM
jgi:predicted Zn-dependent protease